MPQKTLWRLQWDLLNSFWSNAKWREKILNSDFLRCYDCVFTIAALTLLLAFFQILNPHKYHIHDPKDVVQFNPHKKTGLFEGSFFWRDQFDLLF